MDRAVNQGPWLQELDGSFKEGGGLGPNTKKEAPRPTPTGGGVQGLRCWGGTLGGGVQALGRGGPRASVPGG